MTRRCVFAIFAIVGPLLALAPAGVRGQQVEARFDQARIGLGETTTLRVTVRSGSGVRTPEFDLPEGLSVLGSGRQQNFSWVNGRASNEIEFRFEIRGEQTGLYSVGPVFITVGSRVFRGPELRLEVTERAASPNADGGGEGAPATLRVEVDPVEPYVGQEVALRVLLIQRAAFAEDPQYVPPITTGFWTDRFTAPESYYADVAGERVLVTETRTRLYPLAIGETVVGEAGATVTVAESRSDPLGWLGGSRRGMVLRSRPVAVRVRPLPDGAPAGFGGAVGDFEATWSADRARTSRDVPVTLRLDVRGRGNLPLMRSPIWSPADMEVFASTVQDSAAGPDGDGRKRFQWTLLPRLEGRVAVEAPPFVWFDPAQGSYRRLAAPAVRIEVGPALFTGSAAGAGFPRSLGDRPVDPGSRPPEPWAFALAGLGIGAAVLLWRRGAKRGAGEPAGAEVGAWLARVREAHGDDFWRTAEETMRWLESTGRIADSPGWRGARDQVATSRYGGSASHESPVRQTLVEHLVAASPRSARALPLRLAALGLAIGSLALAVVFGPRPGTERFSRLARDADQAARQGDLERARVSWLALWNEAGPHPGLAARLAWDHVQRGEIGPAALWVLRGELAEPRDAAARWVAERVREAGGLVGASPPRLPVRRWEWSVSAFVLGLCVVRLRRRRGLAIGLAGLAVMAAAIHPLQGEWAERSGRAVVLEQATLDGSDIQLDPGQIVIVRSRKGDRLRVRAGRLTEGWLPASIVGLLVGEGDG